MPETIPRYNKIMNTNTDNNFPKLILASWVIVAIAFIAAIVAYLYLPPTVPIHFGLNGKPDNYGSKNMIITTPLIIAAINIFFHYTAKRPADKFNYPVVITPENADNQYNLMRYFFAIMRVIVVSVMTLVYGMIINSMFIGYTDMRMITVMMGLVIVSVILPAVIYGLKASKTN